MVKAQQPKRGFAICGVTFGSLDIFDTTDASSDHGCVHRGGQYDTPDGYHAPMVLLQYGIEIPTVGLCGAFDIRGRLRNFQSGQM